MPPDYWLLERATAVVHISTLHVRCSTKGPCLECCYRSCSLCVESASTALANEETSVLRRSTERHLIKSVCVCVRLYCQPSETSVEEGKAGGGGDARPPFSTPDSGSGAGEEDGGGGCGELGDAARGSDSTEATEMSAAGQGGDREGIGKETDGGDAEESEVANEPEAAAPPPLLLQAGTGLMQGGRWVEGTRGRRR